MTAPRQVLVDVADLEALGPVASGRWPGPIADALNRLVAAIPEPEHLCHVNGCENPWVGGEIGEGGDLLLCEEHLASPEPLPPSFVPLLDSDGRPVVRVPKVGDWYQAAGHIQRAHNDLTEPRTIYTKVETAPEVFAEGHPNRTEPR